MEVKIVINDVKTGKTYQRALDNPLLNKKIGDTVEGNIIGLNGYELKITGGSDSAGFPMRPELQTTERKRLLITDNKNLIEKKLFRGNTISDQTAQINTKVVKYGPKPIIELWNIVEKPKEKPEQKVEKTGEIKSEKKEEKK